MDSLIEWLIQLVSSQDNPAGLCVLVGSAAIEYVFPPFPGDTITLFGAVLITAYGWSFVGVFAAVLAGSVAGSLVAFYVGVRIERWRSHRQPRDPRRRARIEALVDKFRRHGTAYLVINRFLPGLRALFFVAAGMAGMRPGPVAFYSAISAALWNLLLIAAGSLLGANFETLEHWVRTYATAVWIAIGAVVLGLFARAIVRRLKARRDRDRAPPPDTGD